MIYYCHFISTLNTYLYYLHLYTNGTILLLVNVCIASIKNLLLI